MLFAFLSSLSLIYISDLQVLNLCLFRMRIKYMQNKEIYCNITRVRRKQNYIFLPQIARIFTERMIEQLSITP